jgi:hypothetical protein
MSTDLPSGSCLCRVRASYSSPTSASRRNGRACPHTVYFRNRLEVKAPQDGGNRPSASSAPSAEGITQGRTGGPTAEGWTPEADGWSGEADETDETDETDDCPAVISVG